MRPRSSPAVIVFEFLGGLTLLLCEGCGSLSSPATYMFPPPPGFAAPLPASTSPSPLVPIDPVPPAAGAGAPVSFDFKDADVRSVLRLLSLVGGVQIVATDQVQGQVTLKVDNVPWDQALAMVAKRLNLRLERQGDVVQVTSVAGAGSEHGEAPAAVAAVAPAPAPPLAREPAPVLGRELAPPAMTVVPSGAPAGTESHRARVDSGAAVSPQAGLNPPVSFNFKDADVRNVLRLLAETSGKEIIATDDVRGGLTLKLDNVPWDQALEIIAVSLNLNVERLGNVIRVTSAARAEADEEARERGESLRTEMFQLRFARASYVAGLLAGEHTHAAPTMGYEGGAEFPDQVGDSGPLFPPAGNPAPRAARSVPRARLSVLSPRGSATADEPSNTLIVTDVQRGLAAARQVIQQIDRPAPQVEIESRIIETSDAYDRALGVQWGYRYFASTLTGNPTGFNFPGSVTFGGQPVTPGQTGLNNGIDPITGTLIPFLADFPAAGGLTAGHGSALDLTLGSIDQTQLLDMRLTQLEDAQKIKIISRPTIVTRNNQQAVIKSVDILRVRLPGSTIFGGYGLGVAFESIEVGVLLKVRPQVSADGYILLDLQAVSSSLVPNEQVDNIPVQSERATESHVLLRDGQTLVVGGIYRLEDTVSNQGVPFLESMPGLGWLFGEAERHNKRENLLIMVTPRRLASEVVATSGTLPSAGQLWLNRSASGF